MTDGKGPTGAPGDPGAARPGLPFDTVANLRALGEVQRRGLEAANRIIERLLGSGDGAEQGSTEQGDGTSDKDAVADLFGAWLDGMSAVMDTTADRSGRPSAGSGKAAAPESHGHGPEQTGPVEVLSAPMGRQVPAEVEFWLHNYTSEDLVAVRPAATELIGPGGRTWHSHPVEFQPAGAFDLPSRSSRGVRAVVTLPDEAPPGTYRAIVGAAGLREQWLVLEVELSEATEPHDAAEPPDETESHDQTEPQDEAGAGDREPPP